MELLVNKYLLLLTDERVTTISVNPATTTKKKKTSKQVLTKLQGSKKFAMHNFQQLGYLFKSYSCNLQQILDIFLEQLLPTFNMLLLPEMLLLATLHTITKTKK